MPHRHMHTLRLIGLAGLALATASCENAYYRAMEAAGKYKRDLLVERVEDVRDTQQEAKQQFRTAYDRFAALVGFEGGDLEATYDDLRSQLEASEARAEAVRRHIADVRDVARALFDEWEQELDEYDDDELRLSSEIQLRDTQKRFAVLLRAMKRAEGKMEPILAAFRDQVLFLKHNLNARAVASLEENAAALESDVAALIADMEASIQEANAFIDAMGQP
jgi:hypothetical protein